MKTVSALVSLCLLVGGAAVLILLRRKGRKKSSASISTAIREKATKEVVTQVGPTVAELHIKAPSVEGGELSVVSGIASPLVQTEELSQDETQAQGGGELAANQAGATTGVGAERVIDLRVALTSEESEEPPLNQARTFSDDAAAPHLENAIASGLPGTDRSTAGAIDAELDQGAGAPIANPNAAIAPVMDISRDAPISATSLSIDEADPLAAPDAEPSRESLVGTGGARETDVEVHTEAPGHAANSLSATTALPTDVRAGDPRQRRYRSPSRIPSPRRLRQQSAPLKTVDRGAKVDVRLVFQRGGACRVSLVPRRSDSMPPRLTVSHGAQTFELNEMQDGWYEDVFIDDIGEQLVTGIAWESHSEDGRRFRWALGGRDVFVLTSHSELGGFVDTNRLVLNEQHIVLCTEAMEQAVRAALEATGASSAVMLTTDRGTPVGWIAFAGVVPRRVVAASPNSGNLDCLIPSSAAELILEGGIRVQSNDWLSGFPPIIRIKGDPEEVHEIIIDGKGAVSTPSGNYTAPGWNTNGPHFIASSVGNRSYRIVEPNDGWTAWPAHNWSSGDHEERASLAARPSVCGALVLPPAERDKAIRAVVVPSTNVVLVGAIPGQIETCKRSSDRTSRDCMGFPSFEPSWALPADAMHCDRTTTSIILLRPLPPTSNNAPTTTRHKQREVRAWCAAVLCASRKRLIPQPDEPEARKLWDSYRAVARQLLRSMR